MGVPAGEEEKYGVDPANLHRSEPQTEINIEKFAIGTFPVTKGEFRGFVQATGWEFTNNKGCWDSYGKPKTAPDDPRRAIGRNNLRLDLSWFAPGFKQTDDHPVVCVAWIDILGYLEWLSRKTGYLYRLPSESEWEYVARAGTTTPRPWPDDENACQHANVADLTRAKAYDLDPSPEFAFQCEDGFPDTSPVGSFPANKFGVFDMIGNVWQVTADAFQYSLENVPQNGAPQTVDEHNLRTVRGGSYDIFPYAVRSGYRSRFELFRDDSGPVRLSYEGFRVARSLD